MTNNRTESGPLEDSSGPIAGDAKDFAIAALEEKVRRLREALTLFMALDPTFSTICQKHLDEMVADGEPMAVAVQAARAALKDTE